MDNLISDNISEINEIIIDENNKMYDESFIFGEDEDVKILQNTDLKVCNPGMYNAYYYEKIFFETMMVNYWLLIKNIDRYTITFINDISIGFMIRPNGFGYYQIQITNIKNNFYDIIYHKNCFINEMDSEIFKISINLIIYCSLIYNTYLYKILLEDPPSLTIGLLQAVKCITGPTTFS